MWKAYPSELCDRLQLEPTNPYYYAYRYPTITSVEQVLPMHPLPDVPRTLGYTDPDDTSVSLWAQGYPSPSDSGFSSHFGRSDTEKTPFSSPETRHASYTPEATGFENHTVYDQNGQATYEAGGCILPGPCVALPDVQFLADTQAENGTFEDEPAACAFQEGYHPIQDPDLGPVTSVVASLHHCTEDVDGDAMHPTAPVLRRRRPSDRRRSATGPYLPSRIGKRSLFGKRATSHQDRPMNTQITSKRSFPCPFTIYGCTSTFDSKNEWKRHITTQHMHLGYWRCDQCPQADRKPNDFNRKDLFIQHVRRMHPFAVDEKKSKKRASGNLRGGKSEMEEQVETDIAQRCYHKQRDPPEQSSCIFCKHDFDGPNSWEERLEHIGKHMESTKKDGKDPVHPKQWRLDGIMEDYLAREGLITKQRGEWELADAR